MTLAGLIEAAVAVFHESRATSYPNHMRSTVRSTVRPAPLPRAAAL